MLTTAASTPPAPVTEPGGAGPGGAGSGDAEAWWRTAAIYEVYPRSFADSDGDGQGDLGGVVQHLDHLATLGVDAVWIAPWFPSPMADGGYDITDPRDIHPQLGTLAAAESLLDAAHARGIRVVMDLVANHTSVQHPWFGAAVRDGRGSPARDRHVVRDGRGPAGDLPPNNWISAFGGPAWTRPVEPDGAPGQWYLHAFAPEQPDLNWHDDGVRHEFDEILRFWFDRGVDGIRVDAAPALVKEATLPDADYGDDVRFLAARWVDDPHWDVDGVHDVLRRWRAIGDRYEPPRMLVAEAVVNGAERLGRYLGPDEMHTAFDFDFLKAPWGPGLREVVDATLAALAPTGAPATWVLASHDEPRLVTRYGRARTASVHIADDEGAPSDRALGVRRARAAALLLLVLPGGAYVYQGEELGLPEVEDLPAPVRVRAGRLRDVAAAAGGLARADGRGAVAGPLLDARAVPQRPAGAPGPPRVPRRVPALASGPRRRPRLRPGDRRALRGEPLPAPRGPRPGRRRTRAARQRSLDGSALPSHTAAWIGVER